MSEPRPGSDEPTLALLGTPNVGKTSLFNLLTGLRQKIGNYPGVTVERRDRVTSRSRSDTRARPPGMLRGEALLGAALQLEPSLGA